MLGHKPNEPIREIYDELFKIACTDLISTIEKSGEQEFKRKLENYFEHVIKFVYTPISSENLLDEVYKYGQKPHLQSNTPNWLQTGGYVHQSANPDHNTPIAELKEMLQTKEDDDEDRMRSLVCDLFDKYRRTMKNPNIWSKIVEELKKDGHHKNEGEVQLIIKSEIDKINASILENNVNKLTHVNKKAHTQLHLFTGRARLLKHLEDDYILKMRFSLPRLNEDIRMPIKKSSDEKTQEKRTIEKPQDQQPICPIELSDEAKKAKNDIFVGLKRKTTEEQRAKVLRDEPIWTKFAGKIFKECQDAVLVKYLETHIYLSDPSVYDTMVEIACETLDHPIEVYDLWLSARLSEQYSIGGIHISQSDFEILTKDIDNFMKQINGIDKKQLEEMFIDDYEIEGIEYSDTPGEKTINGINYFYDHVYS